MLKPSTSKISLIIKLILLKIVEQFKYSVLKSFKMPTAEKKLNNVTIATCSKKIKK